MYQQKKSIDPYRSLKADLSRDFLEFNHFFLHVKGQFNLMILLGVKTKKENEKKSGFSANPFPNDKF